MYCGYVNQADAVSSPDVVWTAPCLVTNFTSLSHGSYIANIAPDGHGGCYVFGTLRGGSLFNGTKTDAATYDLPRFLAKLDSSGHLDWLRPLGGGPINPGFAVSTEGNIILAGVFWGEANLDNHPLKVSDPGELLIASFDPQGHCRKIQKPNLKADDILGTDAFEVDQCGNFVIAGDFAHRLTTPTGVIKTRGQIVDLFLSRCDSNGLVVTTTTMHGPGRKLINQIAIDSKNAVLVAGHFEKSLDISNIHLEGGEKQTAFIAKFDTEGKCEWAKDCGGKKFSDAESIATDDQGNIYLTGLFVEGGDFFGESLRATGEGDLFLCKMSPDGKLFWAHSYGKSGFTGGFNLVVGKAGMPLLTGYHEGGGNFQIGNFPMRGSPFTAGFDTQGVPLWVKELTAGADLGTSVLLKQDVRGDLYLTGTFDRLPATGPNERFVFAVSKMRSR